VQLAQVGLRRVAGDARAVLHGLAGVRVAVHAEPFDERDRVRDVLADAVLGVAVDGLDGRLLEGFGA
jgi:hypothetical protein